MFKTQFLLSDMFDEMDKFFNVKDEAYNKDGVRKYELPFPGIAKEDIDFEIWDKQLIISGKTGERSKKYYVPILTTDDIDNTDAEYADGLLILTIKKIEKKNNKTKIKIK